ncbi:MAG: hypothetical protein KDJ52_00165 [Anaerolineae bacterium]|nr:hypothetical protein [Anaerolineae bacterium]
MVTDRGKKNLAEDFFSRLTWLFDARESKEPAELPEELNLNDPELAWQVWTTLEGIDWRWPPDVILRQDEAIMEDILTIASYAGKINKNRKP